KRDPGTVPMPRYWVAEEEVRERLVKRRRDGGVEWGWNREWLLGFRDIARSTDERTAIFSIVPLTGVGNNLPLLFTEAEPAKVAALLANLVSHVFDYPTRQKIAGTHMNFFLVRQLPVLPPEAFSETDLNFILPRVLELVFTADDLLPFALDLGYDCPPQQWNEERRFW